MTPTDVIGFLLTCAQTHLMGRPGGVPPIVLVGAEGVGRPYGCCDGILLVESLGMFKWSDDNGERLVSGRDPCDAVIDNQYRVTVKRCAPSFAPGTTGAAPLVSSHNQLALDLVAESWLLTQAVICCVNDDQHCGVDGRVLGRVLDATHSLGDGCQSFSTTIQWEHTPCC